MNLMFLCTGNSCRSQMAEGWARHIAGDKINVYSAGIEAHGKNPRAIQVMAEAGVDISAQESTQITEKGLHNIDYLVTVCGHADEHCPALESATVREHWPLQDPAKCHGSEQQILDVFRASRDEIKMRVEQLLKRIVT